MKHFAYPATIFSCVKQPLQGGKKIIQKSENRLLLSVPDGPKVQSPPPCSRWVWCCHCPTPGLFPLPHHFIPIVPCTHSWPGAISHCRCTRGPAQDPISLYSPPPETSTARKGCSEATATSAAHRQTDSRAHPPPLIRLRSESTSSAPSMATSSCRKKRYLVWKPLSCSVKVLLLAQLGRVSGPKQQPEMSLNLGPP